jgi:peptide subunit release factor 1 (eRF1)
MTTHQPMDRIFQMADENIEMWKIKKLIKNLTDARGNGTSMISLIIPVLTSDLAQRPDF